MDEGNTSVDDILRNVNNIKELRRQYLELNARIDNVFGNEYEDEFLQIHNEQNKYINDFIQLLLQKSQQNSLAETTFIEENEKEKRLMEEELHKRKQEEQIKFFNGIFENIRERGNILQAKCKISLVSFSDSEILEKLKDAKKLDKEFYEILDWITEVVKACPTNYYTAEGILNLVSNGKNELKILKSNYQENLSQEITNHDLSAEKVKNASVLKINVPKYNGYESELDFYTFRLEFEKLISPHILAKLMPEYLKNNYLEGQALEIVKEINVIEEIWEHLKTSFKNVTILLTNKLSDVAKCGPLWKIKNEDKLINQITKLINGMAELNNLAEKHKIEESLFHQSNIQKIYDLIGKLNSQSKILIKN